MKLKHDIKSVDEVRKRKKNEIKICWWRKARTNEVSSVDEVKTEQMKLVWLMKLKTEQKKKNS